MQALRTCIDCKQTKHLGNFSLSQAGGHYYQAKCKPCRVSYNSQYIQRTGYRSPDTYPREHKRNTEYRYKYGISHDDKLAMIAAQGGLCANLGCSNRATALDHCHATGKIRGVLCMGCNTALGHCHDNTNRILGLAAYLDPKPAGAGEALLWL